jgi:hypothetical protein
MSKRLKTILSATLFVATPFLHVAACAQTFVWQGTAVVEEISTTLGEQCTAIESRLQVGDAMRLVFRPHGLGDNGQGTRLAFFTDTKTTLIRLPIGVPFSGTVVDATKFVISDGGATNYQVKIDGASVAPAVFDQSNKRLTLTGWVGLFASCRARIRAHVLLRS